MHLEPVEPAAVGEDVDAVVVPRDDEFDPGHTMSPPRPAEGGEQEPAPAATAFDDGATPALPLEFALNSSSPTSSDGVVVVVESDGSGLTTIPQLSDADGKPNYAALIDPKDSARQMRCLAEAIRHTIDGPLTERLYASLPFELTGAQPPLPVVAWT